MAYKNIIVAVDLVQAETDAIVRQAQSLAGPQSKLYVVHVFELAAMGYAGTVDGGVAITGGLQHVMTNARQEAQRRLADLGVRFSIPTEQCLLLDGRPASVVHELANNPDLDVDLVVVGSHGRHGLGLLLGSTANAVLHGAPCDVLAVRVNDGKK